MVDGALRLVSCQEAQEADAPQLLSYLFAEPVRGILGKFCRQNATKWQSRFVVGHGAPDLARGGVVVWCTERPVEKPSPFKKRLADE